MKRTIIVLLSLIAIVGCQQQEPKVDFELEKSKILEMHNLQRDYHFNKDSIAFANQMSDNFVGVGRGDIKYPTKAENTTRYNRYFSAVNFEKWDDVSEPIIRFSEDGKLAYTIVDKIVAIKYLGEAGDSIQSETHYAWTTIYKKYGETWKIDCVTSTEKPNGN